MTANPDDATLARVLRKFLRGENHVYRCAYEELDRSVEPPAPYRVLTLDGSVQLTAAELAAIEREVG